jgi:hypothetical protein
MNAHFPYFVRHDSERHDAESLSRNSVHRG